MKNIMQSLGVGYHQVVLLSRVSQNEKNSQYIVTAMDEKTHAQAPTTAPCAAELTHPFKLAIAHLILIEYVTLVS